MWREAKFFWLFGLILITSGLLFMWLSYPKVNVPPSNSSPTPTPIEVPGEAADVTEVVDGDTIKVRLNNEMKTVRYLGVDTPETKDPRKSVECFGQEAYFKNKNLVENKGIVLQKDISDKDKYDRLLRYVFVRLEDGRILFVNDYLIRAGFAKVLTIPPDVKYADQFVEAQNQARQSNSGLWGGC